MNMTIKGLSSSNYNFGSLASIRKQAQAVADRKEIQRAELRAERERTGLIKNENGEMVPISSLSEKEISVLEERELKQSTTPQEALLAALATAPNSDEVELNKQMAAKATKMQNKLLQGKRLSGEEIRFLREHFPHLAAIANRMEQEVQQLEKGLKGCNSKEEARQVYMNAKSRVMGSANQEDGSILVLMPALDKAYNEYLKQGTSGKKMNTWA